MKVKIRNRISNEFDAEILPISKSEIKKLSKNWKFNWLDLHSHNAKLFQIIFNNEIQGLIKLEEENESYHVLKNIEVSPKNYGANGKFINIAELLMSYSCLKSFELNLGHYKGYLVFTSKGSSIEYYKEKYKAQLIFRERMIIDPEQGKILILQNLQIDLNNE